MATLVESVSQQSALLLTVLALPRVALDHLIPGLEARERHVSDRVLLMVSLLGGDDGSKRSEGEVDTGERNKVRLELVQVDVEGTIETEGGGDRRDNLSDQPVEVGEARRRDVEPLLANVVNSLVVDLRNAHTSIIQFWGKLY